MIAFITATLFTPTEQIDRPLLLVEDQRIVELTSSSVKEVPLGVQRIDLDNAILAPGFVDIHVHGGGGYDVMQPDASGFRKLYRYSHRSLADIPNSFSMEVDTHDLRPGHYHKIAHLMSNKSEGQ